MKFYPKKNIDIGTGIKSNGTRGDQVLSIVLLHGDMVVMHGEGIQKCYLVCARICFFVFRSVN